MSDDRQLKQIEPSLRDIRELHPRFEATIERLEKRLDDLGTGALGRATANHLTSTPVCCDSGLAWLALGCLFLRWVSGRGRRGLRIHVSGHVGAGDFSQLSITNCRSAGCARSASTWSLRIPRGNLRRWFGSTILRKKDFG
jgi:hypothetical protein